MIVSCIACGRQYDALRRSASYCSGACRRRAHYARHRPPLRALDLFCGSGGTCAGLQRAGFEVTGVDVDPHPDYPGLFIQHDLTTGLPIGVNARDFDFVWASPPCELFSPVRNPHRGKVADPPDLIPLARGLIGDHPFACIENVPQAPLRRDLVLDMYMWGEAAFPRERAFELTWPVMVPPSHGQKRPVLLSATKGQSYEVMARREAVGLPKQPSIEELSEALGIDHVTTGGIEARRHRLVKAVPPVYAEYIGRAAAAAIRQRRRRKNHA